MGITRKECLTICTNKPVESKAILKEEAFNEVGLEELIKKNESACIEFFSELTGLTFDPANDQHHVMVLEIILADDADPEKVADAMMWYYGTFTMPAIEKPVMDINTAHEGSDTTVLTHADGLQEVVKTAADANKAVAKRKECRGKSLTEVMGQEIPFHEDSKQYLVISEMKKFEGTKREFHKYMKGVFEANDYASNNIANYVWRTLAKYGERGGTVELVDGCYVISRNI